MKTTISARKEQFSDQGEHPRSWFCVDATGQTLGRLSSAVARILQGKHKPLYTPHVDTGDFVIIINAEKIKLTGRKPADKIYYHHTGYPGGLKAIKAETLLKKDPTALLSKAIKGMMPKNKLNRASLEKLKVYAGPDHPHRNHQPKPLEI
jgi:large subunit ribosomal protein L13